MTTDVEKRVAVTENDVKNIGAVIFRVEDYMRTTSMENRNIIDRLARMETKQDASQEYQERCDKERTAQKEDIVALQRGESRQAGRMGIVSAIVSAVTAAVIAVGAALVGLYHK